VAGRAAGGREVAGRGSGDGRGIAGIGPGKGLGPQAYYIIKLLMYTPRAKSGPSGRLGSARTRRQCPDLGFRRGVGRGRERERFRDTPGRVTIFMVADFRQ
jgi:hypothetical protein